MNDKQFKLYQKNALEFMNAMRAVGGDPVHLYKKNQELLETLSLNGLEVKFALHPHTDEDNA